MKKFISILLIMMLLVSCNNSSADISTENSSTENISSTELTTSVSTELSTSAPEEPETYSANCQADYQTAEDLTAKAETEKLHSQRPVSLKQAEYLNRGLVAIPDGDGNFISWRYLGTDSSELSFNIYRNGTKLNLEPLNSVTNFSDKNAPADAEYTLVPVLNSQEITADAESVKTWSNNYLSIPVKQYEKCDYDIYDASVGDLDGDGKYEIVVRRNPADMELKTRVAYPLIEAYKLDGTYMWTINIGPNEINEIDINFLVYDFDGDGKAEVVTRSFEGTTDGIGNVIGDVNGDNITNYEFSIQKFKDRQYLSQGPEFLSVYDGITGAEIARTDLLPSRDPLTSWISGGNTGTRTKRASHHLFTVAYLDGVTPSIVYFRGAWAACKAAAYDFKNNSLNVLWQVDCENTNTLENLYSAGYHSIATADIDFDRKDEILTGSAAIDHDGTIMYVTTAEKEDGTLVKLGHGDAFDVAKMSPDFNGYYVWSCQETANLPVNIGLHDARTGQVLMGYTKTKDTGRSRAADIDPTNRGWEMWGSTGTILQGIDGTYLADASPSSMNMKMYWDGDLLAELVDHNSNSNVNILKWDWEKKTLNEIFVDKESSSNGGTKGNNCLTADILGDWRDELIVRTSDNKELRIYSTTIPTDYKIPTLMHDITYREAIAWQNNHYNQPANVSFYLGAETTEVPVPEIYTVKNGEKITNELYTKEPNTHHTIKILNK